jgi:large conductance mechanosensitive channel
MKLIKEFKTFAMSGNVMDLAVGVIIGAAFGKIVDSLVNDVVMPAIGIIIGGVNFTNLAFTLGDSIIKYGSFIQAVLNFTIVAFSIFIFIKAINKVKKDSPLNNNSTENETTITTPEDITLLREIRDSLKNRN